jgi:type II secretory pathway pseudopilin PulG
MVAKTKNRYLLILIALLIILAAGFIKGCNNKTDKKKSLSQLISRLENYKTKHGIYPLIIDSIGVWVDNDIYYSVDSTRQTFNLTYTESAMNANTVSYSSKTRKWEKRFNY